MTRCKVGDLCFIVPPAPSAIGKTVTVIAAGKPHSMYGETWTCSNPQDTFRLDIPDCMLRPISGVPVDDETPTSIETPIATNIGAQGWM